MANITPSQLKKLNELLNEGGYTPVIANSNSEFEEFFNILGIDVYKEYDAGSKGKTLANFWVKSTDNEALKVLKEVKYLLLDRIDNDFEYNKLDNFFREVELNLNKNNNNEQTFENNSKISILNNYTLNCELGHGGFGDVYLIEDEIKNKLVLKKFRKEFLKEEENIAFAEKFRQEAKILHNISHQNIVKVFNYDLGEHPFYIMEHINGKNIEDYLKVHREDINDIFIQLVNVFEYLESFSILHRDIRPTNILINENKEVKLIDFGFGKKFENNGTIKSKTKMISHAYDTPEEMKQDKQIYTNQTEMYFIGQCLKDIIELNNIKGFKYKDILYKMSKFKVSDRYSSFKEIKNKLYTSNDCCDLSLKEFYQKLILTIKSINANYIKDSYVYSIEEIIYNLENLKKNNQLKDKLNHAQEFLICFISCFNSHNLSQPIIYITYLEEVLSVFNDNYKSEIVFSNLEKDLEELIKNGSNFF